MNKGNVPEINMGRRPEKKGGFLGFLRGAGSGGSNGFGAIGAANSASSSAAGIGGLLAGKISTIVAVALIGGAGATYMVRHAPPAQPSVAGDQAMASAAPEGQRQEYVPAIEREEAANRDVSSLAMFTERNKGMGLSLQEDPNAAAKQKEGSGKDADASAAGAGGGAAGEEGSADPQAMAEGMAEAQIGGASSLTSSLDGASGSGNRLNFGNKLGQAAGKNSMAQLGTGFQAMPKFQERKGKMLAMKSGARPVFSSGKGGKANKFSDGGKTWKQARAMLSRQQSYTGSNANQARSNQDAAWEGESGGGEASADAAGVGDGSAGIMSSPSLDNARGDTTPDQTSDGSGITVDTDCQATGTCADVSPWAEDAANAAKFTAYATMIGLAAGLLIVAANKVSTMEPYGEIICTILKIIAGIMLAIALGMAAYALICAQKVMWGSGYKGQALMGGIYTIGAGFALAGNILMVTELLSKKDPIKTLKEFGSTNATWCMLAGSMVSGLAGMLGM